MIRAHFFGALKIFIGVLQLNLDLVAFRMFARKFEKSSPHDAAKPD